MAAAADSKLDESASGRCTHLLAHLAVRQVSLPEPGDIVVPRVIALKHGGGEARIRRGGRSDG